MSDQRHKTPRSSGVLLHTSQEVRQAEERVQALGDFSAREKEKIRMLRAEWEALNRPERLERLANEFLELVPPTSDQIATKKAPLPEPLHANEVPDLKNQEGKAKIYDASMSNDPKAQTAPASKEKPPENQNIPASLTSQEQKSFEALIDELEDTK